MTSAGIFRKDAERVYEKACKNGIVGSKYPLAITVVGGNHTLKIIPKSSHLSTLALNLTIREYERKEMTGGAL